MYVYICMCLYVCVYMYVYVHMYVCEWSDLFLSDPVVCFLLTLLCFILQSVHINTNASILQIFIACTILRALFAGYKPLQCWQ